MTEENAFGTVADIDCQRDDISSTFKGFAFERAKADNAMIFDYYFSEVVSLSMPQVYNLLEDKLGCKRIFLEKYFNTHKKKSSFLVQKEVFFADPFFYCILTPRDQYGVVTMQLYSVGDNSKIELVARYLEKHFVPKVEKGSIYSLAQNGSQLYFQEIGEQKEEFVKTNYSEEVCELRDYMIEELNKEKPNGRLNILLGPPGLGKTMFIKSLITEVAESIFVYIPPHMIPSISGPNIIGAITSYKNYNRDKKIVFVLEDADQVLAKRMGDNIADINGLLNLSDGFLASCFDIRIIATSNTKKNEIDDAIMRPGRLCTMLEFEPFTKEQAQKCLLNIAPKQKFELEDKETYSLAEIYQHVANARVMARKVKPKKSLGF